MVSTSIYKRISHSRSIINYYIGKDEPELALNYVTNLLKFCEYLEAHPANEAKASFAKRWKKEVETLLEGVKILIVQKEEDYELSR